MKKVLASIMVFSLAMLLLTACGSNQDAVPDAGAAADGTKPRATGKTQVDTSKFIGEEKAKDIALKKAELGADGVKFDRVELDHDDGVWQYELDFRHGGMEYDIDINAENGEILSFEKEADF